MLKGRRKLRPFGESAHLDELRMLGELGISYSVCTTDEAETCLSEQARSTGNAPHKT